MFEYQGNRPNQSQSLNRTNSRASSYMREGPYSKLDTNKVKEPPVNSQELHQFDDVADEGVDYSFSNLSVRERKKLFQQQNESNNRSFGPTKNVIGSMNNFHHPASHYAHETQSDIGDEREWRSKASTWTPKDFNNQTRTNSPQIFPSYDREEKRGASVINFRPQLATTPTHLRSRTIDTGFNRNNDFFPNPNCDPMTRSAAFHTPRNEYQPTMQHTPSTTYLHRNVSGPCTRVIPTGTSNRPTLDSGYDSYFDKSRISSPHADRYRSQVHIPLATRNRNNSSYDWQNPRQSRSQQPLRVNVYSNSEARQESINVPIRTQQTINPYYSMSTSNTQMNGMHRRMESRSQTHLTSPHVYNQSSVMSVTTARNSPNSYVVHDQSFQRFFEPNKNLYQSHLQQITPSYYTSPRRVTQTTPQVINMNRSGFYRPTTRTNQVTSTVYNKPYDNTFHTVTKNRERTPMPMTPRSQPNVGEDLNFWTSSNTRQRTQQVVSTPRYQTKSPLRTSTQKLNSGAFFDEEAGISEF